MPRQPRKRTSDAAELTAPGLEESPRRAPKTSRKASNGQLANAGTGQRFGENTEFVDLTQTTGAENTGFIPLTQNAGDDEDEAAATEVVQNSQVVDDTATSGFVFYGQQNDVACPFI